MSVPISEQLNKKGGEAVEYSYESYRGFAGPRSLRIAHSSLLGAITSEIGKSERPVTNAVIHLVVCMLADTDPKDSAGDLVGRVAGFDT